MLKLELGDRAPVRVRVRVRPSLRSLLFSRMFFCRFFVELGHLLLKSNIYSSQGASLFAARP